MGFLALGLSQGQLYMAIRQPNTSQTDRLLIGPTTDDSWHSLDLHLAGTSLNVTLNSSSSQFTLNAPIGLKDIYFGGAHTFFAPIYTSLDMTEYFIGCLSQVVVNGRPLPLVPAYGIASGCCATPHPVVWDFTAENSTIAFSVRLNREQFRQQLTVSFQLLLEPGGNGIVLFYLDGDDSLVVELLEGVLAVVVQSERLQCPSISDPGWHSVSLLVSPGSLACSVDDQSTSRGNLTIPIPSITRFSAGQPSASRELPSGLRLQPVQGRLPSFTGRLAQLQFGGIDIHPSLLESVRSRLECGRNQVSPESPNCTLHSASGVAWGGLSVLTQTVPVKEQMEVTLTTGHLRLLDSSDALNMHSLEPADLLAFEVVTGPDYGYFAKLSSSIISSFSYQDVRDAQVVYRHHGDPILWDSVLLRASVVCEGEEVFAQTLSLNFSVTPVNDEPHIFRKKELRLAVGTRRVITPDIITVRDEESTSPTDITFQVVSIDTCHGCGGRQAGIIEQVGDANVNLPHVFFTQEKINNHQMAFQHFAAFATSPVQILLNITDWDSGRIQTAIHVTPFQGHISLNLTTSPSCLYVAEGGVVDIGPHLLSATTDFQDQNPVLTYDVIRPPRHGRLERLVAFVPSDNTTWQWVPLPELSREENSFTQEQVDARHAVRYVHNYSSDTVNSSTIDDSFHFRLRSTNLTGPEGELCFRILSSQTLPVPDIVVELGQATVVEGEELALTEAILNARLSSPVLAHWLQAVEGAERLRLDYRVLPHLGPAHGHLLLDRQPLPNNSFTVRDVRRGAVYYVHDGSEEHSDFFSFFVEARNSSGLSQLPPPTSNFTLAISILPVNNHPPKILPVGAKPPISPPEGGVAILSLAMLGVTDADRPGDVLDVFLESPELDSGHFALRSMANQSIARFTVAEVRSHRVVYVHRLNGSASLNLTQKIRVADGRHTTEGVSVLVLTASPLAH